MRAAVSGVAQHRAVAPETLPHPLRRSNGRLVLTVRHWTGWLSAELLRRMGCLRESERRRDEGGAPPSSKQSRRGARHRAGERGRDWQGRPQRMAPAGGRRGTVRDIGTVRAAGHQRSAGVRNSVSRRCALRAKRATASYRRRHRARWRSCARRTRARRGRRGRDPREGPAPRRGARGGFTTGGEAMGDARGRGADGDEITQSAFFAASGLSASAPTPNKTAPPQASTNQSPYWT